jgi:hypothetical protein
LILFFFIIKKEINYKLILKLQKEEIIIIPRELFKASDLAEFQGLENNKIYKIEYYNFKKYKNKFFDLRLIKKIKNK